MSGVTSFLDYSVFSSHNLWTPVDGHILCSNALLLINGVCQQRRTYKIVSRSSSLSIDTSGFGSDTLTALQNSLTSGVFTSSLWLMLDSAPLSSLKQVLFTVTSAGSTQF